MANIRIDLDHELLHGEELVFKAPCDCTAVSGIKVYYPSEGSTVSKTLIFKDAHGNVLTNIDNLFSSGALIKVLVDSTDGYAYILNADTNAYLEAKITPVDNLESDRADLPLSAKMGMDLGSRVATLESSITSYVEYESGSVKLYISGPDNPTETIVTFTKPFFKVPTVVTSKNDQAASVTVSNIMQSGFKMKVSSSYHSAINPTIQWIAQAK